MNELVSIIDQNVLDLHAKWRRGEEGGKRLVTAIGKIEIRIDLSGADLSGAELRGAELRGAELRGADLSGADLREADLSRADLRGANLEGADLDYSCWPLWCGSNHVKIDRKIAAQLAAHFCALDCDDPDYQAARAVMLEFAKTSHRASELGLK